MCCGELRILLSSIFGSINRLFSIFSQADVILCFSRVDSKLFLAGGHLALSRGELYALSRGQLLRLCFSQALVIAGG
jgi:hypothetical protein